MIYFFVNIPIIGIYANKKIRFFCGFWDFIFVSHGLKIRNIGIFGFVGRKIRQMYNSK
jgi:hypothetical protein